MSDTETKAGTAASIGLKQLGQYKLLKKLGEGGMGAVYLAEDPLAERKVALKVLSKHLAKNNEFILRFQREARAMGRLNHPNIVSAYSVGEGGGHHFCVMEYCEGKPLDQILAQRKCLSEVDALKIVTEVARGLEHAHAHGIMHRDIKPANIFICTEGEARILDLGLSKSIADDENAFQTQAGLALGTPHYISPEQAKGSKKMDGRADIYSLGATLFHLVTGQTPFHGPNSSAIMLAHLTEKLPCPRSIRPELSSGIVAVIQRMMAKAQEDRYLTCTELLEDINRLQTGQPPAPQSIIETPVIHDFDVKRRARPDAAGAHPSRTAAARGNSSSLSMSTVMIGICACLLATGLIALAVFTKKPANPKVAEAAPVVETPAPVTKSEIPVVTAVAGRPVPAPRKVEPAAHRTVERIAKPSPKQLEPVVLIPELINAINLLARVDPGRDTVSGVWLIKNGELTCIRGKHNRIELPYRPAEEYDFTIEFTRIEGDDVNQVLTHKGRACIWEMGAYDNLICGFDIVANRSANENPTTATYAIQNGRRYTSLVQVRKDGMKAFINGKLISEYKTDWSDVEIYSKWKLRDPMVIGVATHSPAIFHRIEVVEITGKGAFTRP